MNEIINKTNEDYNNKIELVVESYMFSSMLSMLPKKKALKIYKKLTEGTWKIIATKINQTKQGE